jgi:hypothetical protein
MRLAHRQPVIRNPRRLALTAALALAAVLASGCAGQPQPTEEDLPFEIEFPDGWEKGVRASRQFTGAFARSRAQGEDDPYIENMTVQVLAAPTGRAGEDLPDEQIETYRKTVPGFELLERRQAEIGPCSARVLVHTQKVPAEAEGETITVKVLLYLVPHGDRTGMITCTALPETFEQVRPAFEKAAATFRFRDEAQ